MMPLGNDAWMTSIAEDGTSRCQFEKREVTRFQGSPGRDAEGPFVYLRDVASGARWSPTRAPLFPAPLPGVTYSCQLGSERANFIREADDSLTQLTILVPPEACLELRLLELTNLGPGPKTYELSTYAELALHTARDFESHPAFAKLFLETGWEASRELLWCRRRPRFPGEKVLSAAAFVRDGEGRLLRPCLETRRFKFLGRGGSTAYPAGLDEEFDPTLGLGAVLDPIFSFRFPLEIPAGGTRCVILGLTAGWDLGDLLTTTDRFADGAELRRRYFASGFPASSVPRGRTRTVDTSDGLPSPIGFAWMGAIPGKNLRIKQEKHRPDDAWSRVRTDQAPADATPLLFENGLGGFEADGRVYRIRLVPHAETATGLRLPPMPWTHVLANEHCGCIVSERGSCCTWVGNSRENRVTPWFNDPIRDPYGEALFLRDETNGEIWTPLPGPVPCPDATYHVRYGWGFAEYSHAGRGLSQQVTLGVPAGDPVKFTQWTIHNIGLAPRKLRIGAWLEWTLGASPPEDPSAISSWIASKGIVFARRDGWARGPETTSFAAFVGDLPLRDLETVDQRLSPMTPGAMFQAVVELAPGETVRLALLIGEAGQEAEARELIEKYRASPSRDAASSQVKQDWTDRVSSLQVQTPSTAMDLLVNGWLTYQNLVCRMWGRSSYYQGGGAFGFRDQLQDALAFVHQDPARTRRQILLHAAHQFEEGDVLHWWHPPDSRGVRTRFSDDLLWLPYAALEYVAISGDEGIWNERIPYLTAAGVMEGEQERFVVPQVSERTGDLFDHCRRALDRSDRHGAHGLPLMGCGDWNDGMSRVGAAGRGESVWLAFFLLPVLNRFANVCDLRGEPELAATYRSRRAGLVEAIESAAWDGNWYLRAFLDDGSPLGSAANLECQIDALVQAWSVLGRGTDSKKASQAMRSAELRLVDESAGLIRLLDPPFDSDRLDVGYIRGYLPGIRENGGQYTHGVLWFVRALAEMGSGTRACSLWEMLTPIHHARNAAEVARYQVEPYVVAADIYGTPPHVGRGGWSWYTGSAGWMFRVAVESILGITIVRGQWLRISPCIASAWPGFRVNYRVPGDPSTTYEIVVENPDGNECGVRRGTLDGVAVEPSRDDSGTHPDSPQILMVPLVWDGAHHQVVVTI